MKYSRTSRKRVIRVLSLGGRLQEVRAYQSLDHVKSVNFASLAYDNCRDLRQVLNILLMKKSISRENPLFPIDNLPFIKSLR